MNSETLLLLVVIYGAALFAIAWLVERYSGRWELPWLRPLVYTLSIGVYCSSWTFLGAVGQAVDNGWNYLPIYLGPILLIIFGWRFICRLLIISSRNKITSIADFIGSRYGKNQNLAAAVTIVLVIGTLPYVALQLRAVEIAWHAIQPTAIFEDVNQYSSSLIIALVMAWFAIMFGTRVSDGPDRLRGLISVISVESIIKLVAFIAVAALAMSLSTDSDIVSEGVMPNFQWQQLTSPLFFTQMLLAATAIVCLPRQFHVMVVEYHHRSDLRFTRWLMPLYLAIFAVLVIPLANVGAGLYHGTDINPDSYVLSLPRWADAEIILALTFIGAISAATGMVVMATVALSTMISNELIVPLMLRLRSKRTHKGSNNFANALRNIRRVAILGLLLLGWLLDLSTRGVSGLASMGLISFAATAQLLPAVVGALYWSRGHSSGVYAGVVIGMLLWAYCLLLPVLPLGETLVDAGPWGVNWLSPHNLLGMGWLDPISHGVFWSLMLNTLVFVQVSRRSRFSMLDERQAVVFTRLHWRGKNQSVDLEPSNIQVQQLQQIMEPLLGGERTAEIWKEFEQRVGHRLLPHDPTPQFAVNLAESHLAAIIGSASAHKAMQLLAQQKPLHLQDFVNLVGGSSRQLQFSQNLLRTTLETIPQGISVVDADLKLVAWNQHYQQLFDYPKRLLYVGCAIEKIYHYNAMRGILSSESQNVEQEVEKRVVQLRRGKPYRIERVLPNGRVVELQGTPLSNGGYVTTYTDISEYHRVLGEVEQAKETLEERVEQRTGELRDANLSLQRENQLRARVEKELYESHDSKTRFIAAASHDLLQPVNAARLFVASLQEKINSPYETNSEKTYLEQDINNLDSALNQTEQLINSLREIARLSSGKERPHRENFSAYRFLQPLAEEAKILAEQKNLEFVWVDCSLWIFSDSHLLRRVVQNFISNALRYCQQGKVLLGCRRSDHAVIIQVWDTGPGIAEKDQQRIFEEFERLPGTNSSNQGLGLGLSIAQRISQLLSHPIQMSSVLGKGSMFSITVPMGQPQVIQEQMDVTQDPHLKDVSILCVDNEVNILNGMQSLLAQWGCHVVTATNLGEALSRWNMESLPDVALLDYHLDEGTGLDVLDALQLHWQQTVPTIVISADNNESITEKVESAQCYYLAKPVKPAALRNLIKRCVKEKRLLKP